MPDFERLRADWVHVDEGVRRVLSGLRPVPTDEVALEHALGAVIAGPVTARVTLPPFDNAAMDGYAVRGRDLDGASRASPVVLEVGRAVHAGAGPGPALPASGGAVRIMTGAPVPAGCDTVVRVEDTDGERGRAGFVEIYDDRDKERNIRPGGRDFVAGDETVPAGVRVTPGWVAMLAASGWSSVSVYRPPRIAILSCGDELCPPGEVGPVLEGRGIPESNGPMVAAAVRAAGGHARLLGIARDDLDDLDERLRRAEDADLLITLGGASMGEADLMKRALLARGFGMDFWRVRMRPGSPVSFGTLPRDRGPALPVLGLPGNPASAFVSFHVFGYPAIRTLAGDTRVHQPVVGAVAGEPLRAAADLCHFVRVSLDGTLDGSVARPSGPQGSGLVSSLGPAAGLAVLPEGVGEIGPGDSVEVLLLDAGVHDALEPGYRVRIGDPRP